MCYYKGVIDGSAAPELKGPAGVVFLEDSRIKQIESKDQDSSEESA